MARKDKKKKDDDLNDGQSLLGALGIALPSTSSGAKGTGGKKPDAGLGLSFANLNASAPHLTKPGSAVPPRPTLVTKPAAKPAAQSRRTLATLPELPKFVKPDEITDEEVGFNAPPVEGKGKIKQITWSIKAIDQASNIASRQNRALIPLMTEAWDQVKQLRSTIKKQKTLQPAVVEEPLPDIAEPEPTLAAPRPAAKSTAKPASKAMTKPAAAPTQPPAPAKAAQPPPSPMITAREAMKVKLEHAAEMEPEREISHVAVKSKLTDEVLTARAPVEKHKWEEAKSVMAPSASKLFSATAQQSFDESPVSVAEEPEPQNIPVESAYQETDEQAQQVAKATGKDQLLPGGKRVCGKCGGSNFREDDDKNKPLSFTPPFLYAKKYICKNCGKLFLGDQEQAEPVPVQQGPHRAVALKPVVTKPAAKASPQRYVEATWEDTGSLKSEANRKPSAKPSSVFAQKGFKAEPLPSAGVQTARRPAQAPAQRSVPPAAEEAAPAAEATKSEGRLICPNCGGTSFNVISDKSRPVSYGMGTSFGTLYAKVHQCRKCGMKVD
jgi:chemotaxis protein histidine kinase CheA